MVTRCEVCAKCVSGQQQKIIISTETPKYPFQPLGADLFTFLGSEYLITFDCYSPMFEVDKLSYTNSHKVLV